MSQEEIEELLRARDETRVEMSISDDDASDREKMPCDCHGAIAYSTNKREESNNAGCDFEEI
jgi:hypothetical protein